MNLRRLLSASSLICLIGLAPAAKLSLDDVVDRTASRVVEVRGNQVAAIGYVMASLNGVIVVATALHGVESVFTGSPTSLTLRWTAVPDGCSPTARSISVHTAAGEGNQPRFDVALIVANAGCTPDLRGVPSAWAVGEPSPGSRFYAFRVGGEPPVASEVGPFWFSNACLLARECFDRNALELKTQGLSEKGMSGGPVVTQAGIAGVLLGLDKVAAWPAVETTAALCANVELPLAYGIGATNLSCLTVPASAGFPVTLAMGRRRPDAPIVLTASGCDPRIGQPLRDSAELGYAYLCRLQIVEQKWAEASAGLDCREWIPCRDTWLQTVAAAGFPLGFSPPREWIDLLELLELRGYPVELVLSHPDDIKPFRQEFAKKGFE